MNAKKNTLGKAFWNFDNSSIEAARAYHRRVNEHPFNGQLYDRLVGKLHDQHLSHAPMKILDAGGGTAKWSMYLAEKGHQVTLIDISEAMLAVAEENCQASGTIDNIKLIQGDIRAMDLADNSFDMVVSDRNTISFCGNRTDALKAIRECHRVLKPGGHFLGSVHNRYREVAFFISKLELAKARALMESGEFNEGGSTAVYYFTPTELTTTFEEVGFQDIRLMPTTAFVEFIPTAWVLDEQLINELYEFEEAAWSLPDTVAMGVRIHFSAEKE